MIAGSKVNARLACFQFVLERENDMNIKEWAVEDRPREKLSSKGAKQLTNAELLAIILSSGTKARSALGIAKDLLSIYNNSLEAIAFQDINDLCKVNGIGRAKAVTIKAALELANRRSRRTEDRRKITCSENAFEEISHHLMDLEVEEFWVIFLNRANRVIGKERISSGGVASTIVDPKLIFKPAISLLAMGLILCHNHPSGNLKPSKQDIVLTQRIVEAGKNLDMIVQDHLIVSGDSYYSFADEGLM